MQFLSFNNTTLATTLAAIHGYILQLFYIRYQLHMVLLIICIRSFLDDEHVAVLGRYFLDHAIIEGFC